jgi:predicted dehydrogenase
MRHLGARGLGRPAITAAHASPRDPGVDEWCDVELRFPSGATGLSANSMTAEDYSFTINVVGTKGDALVHDFIRPHTDDRITIRTPAGPRVEHLGTRPSYTYQLEAFAAHVLEGAPLPIGVDDAVQNMHYVDTAYRAAGMQPR